MAEGTHRDAQRAGLGNAFVLAVDAAIANAAANPFLYPRVRNKPELRRVLTRRFPYRVFFIRERDAIVVLRVLHGARDDREWKRSRPDDET